MRACVAKHDISGSGQNDRSKRFCCTIPLNTIDQYQTGVLSPFFKGNTSNIFENGRTEKKNFFWGSLKKETEEERIFEDDCICVKVDKDRNILLFFAGDRYCISFYLCILSDVVDCIIIFPEGDEHRIIRTINRSLLLFPRESSGEPCRCFNYFYVARILFHEDLN